MCVYIYVFHLRLKPQMHLVWLNLFQLNLVHKYKHCAGLKGAAIKNNVKMTPPRSVEFRLFNISGWDAVNYKMSQIDVEIGVGWWLVEFIFNLPRKTIGGRGREKWSKISSESVVFGIVETNNDTRDASSSSTPSTWSVCEGLIMRISAELIPFPV